jgi:hypothetical protein
MKTIKVITLLIILVSVFSVFGKLQLNKNTSNKEAIELAYIIDCFRTGEKMDSLIEWKLTRMNDESISFNKKGRLAFFTFYKDSEEKYLYEINYCKGSFQKMIYIDEATLNQYKITCKTKYKVLMSKDKLRIYFCLLNQNKLSIWVLSDGDRVFTSDTILITNEN